MYHKESFLKTSLRIDYPFLIKLAQKLNTMCVFINNTKCQFKKIDVTLFFK